jgi:hypothetical protein
LAAAQLFGILTKPRRKECHRHVNRQITAAEVVNNLGPIGPKPPNEAQARELAPLQRRSFTPTISRALKHRPASSTRDRIKTIGEIEAKGEQPAALKRKSGGRCRNAALCRKL